MSNRTSSSSTVGISSRKRRNQERYAKYHKREIKSDAVLVREYREERDELRTQLEQAEASEQKIKQKSKDFEVAKGNEVETLREERDFFKSKYNALKSEFDNLDSMGVDLTIDAHDDLTLTENEQRPEKLAQSLKRRLKLEESKSESLRIKLKHQNKSIVRQDDYIENLKFENKKVNDELKLEKIGKVKAENEFKNLKHAHDVITMERDMNQYHVIQFYESAMESHGYAKRACLSVDGLSGGKLEDAEYRAARTKHIKDKYRVEETEYWFQQVVL